MSKNKSVLQRLISSAASSFSQLPTKSRVRRKKLSFILKILNKLKTRGFLASGLSTYDFSTLYTTLSHNLIKEKLTELIEQKINRMGSLYSACNDKNAFFTSEQPKRYKLWSCQKMCDALHYLLDNIFIRRGSKLYRQIVGYAMGTNCAPLVADLFLFCYERDFMLSLSNNNQTDIIEAFDSTSRYLMAYLIMIILILNKW